MINPYLLDLVCTFVICLILKYHNEEKEKRLS